MQGERTHGCGLPKKQESKETTDVWLWNQTWVFISIQIPEGEANCKEIEDELKNLIDPKWDWQVRELTPNGCSATFRNQKSLGTFPKLFDESIFQSPSDATPRAHAKSKHLV